MVVSLGMGGTGRRRRRALGRTLSGELRACRCPDENGIGVALGLESRLSVLAVSFRALACFYRQFIE
ncbi:hypothetical protein COCNU_08G004960 [Cocos nucifera]|uniref:Uncharacterized protein n=1 Tax=Cocos nucifera TaxID=13894 RepID=A0A8K0II93_COCNU|nr:hypothetical protein COCNU_08G004960 [Cocos nucifera]